MTSRFFLTPDAKASLKNIAIYTQTQWGEKQRRTYLKILDACFHMLATHPHSGAPRPEIHPTLRSHHESSHIIYYIPQADHIIIVNVLHERMDPHRHITVKN